MSSSVHIPVLFEETLAVLAPERGGHFLDCTFGGGGHSREILNRAPAGTQLSALDRDPEAAVRAEAFKRDFGDAFHFYNFKFSRLDEVPGAPFAGILMDIGVSSFQLDDENRGFSFRKNAPTDMRMDPRNGISAADFLESAEHSLLVEAVRDFGEEPRWRQVVDAIVGARGSGILGSTATFAALIEKTIGRKPGSKIHPATKTFQGVRIAVNNELGELSAALPKAFDALDRGGVLALITFHSLEDRIVKQFFNKKCGRPINRFDSRPQDEREVFAEMLTRKGVTAGAAELAVNPRSRSAKLRAIRKL